MSSLGRVRITAAALALLSNAAATAQEMLHLPAEVLLQTRVHLPADYSDGSSYPLVLALHGHGGSLETFDFLAPLFQQRGVILAAAQAPYPFVHEQGLGFDWQNRRSGSDEAAAQATRLTIDYVRQVAAELRERFAVDELYLLGFSQGGSMAYRIAIGDPSFRGMLAFGSSFRAEWLGAQELAATPQLRVFIAHGIGDRLLIANATGARDLLRHSGYAVAFQSFGGAHEIPPRVAAQAIDWILDGRGGDWR